MELPRATWVDRLNAFTIAHEGWIVSLEVFGPEIGAQPEIVNLPLIGVSADRVDHDGTIAVSVAQSGVGHLTHIIHDVTHIGNRSRDGYTCPRKGLSDVISHAEADPPVRVIDVWRLARFWGDLLAR